MRTFVEIDHKCHMLVHNIFVYNNYKYFIQLGSTINFLLGMYVGEIVDALDTKHTLNIKSDRFILRHICNLHSIKCSLVL